MEIAAWRAQLQARGTQASETTSHLINATDWADYVGGVGTYAATSGSMASLDVVASGPSVAVAFVGFVAAVGVVAQLGGAAGCASQPTSAASAPAVHQPSERPRSRPCPHRRRPRVTHI